MRILLLLAALLAAGSLLVSGVQKLGRRELVLQSIDQLRLPKLLRQKQIATAVPVLEIVLGAAVLLTAGPARVVAAALVALLHLAYLVVVTRAASGRWGASCHCFGGLAGGEVTWRTVARNGVLTAAAGVLLVGPADEPGIVLGAAVLIGCWAGAAYLRTRERQQDAAPPPEELVLYDVTGAPLPLRTFERPATVLVFFAPGCGGCAQLVPYFRWWPSFLPDSLDLQPVLRGPQDQFRQLPAFDALVDHAWFDPDAQVSRAVGVYGTPAAVRISEQTPRGGEVATGRAAIEQLLTDHGARIQYDRTESS